MGMNLHCFNLPACNSRRAETPGPSTAAQNSQQASCQNDVGQLGAHVVQKMLPGQPRTDSASPWWSNLSHSLAMSGKWLLHQACEIILPVHDTFGIKTRIYAALNIIDAGNTEIARKKLVAAFQSDPCKEEMAALAIVTLKIAGADDDVHPEHCVMKPALMRMDDASLKRLKTFAENKYPQLSVMHTKISSEAGNRQSLFNYALRDEFRKLQVLSRTDPLQSQSPLWASMHALSQSVRFKNCSIAEAASYILSSADVSALIFLAKALTSGDQNPVLRQFCTAAENEMKTVKSPSSAYWHGLLDEEMDEFGAFFEIKNSGGDKSFENLFTSWEQEKDKRTRSSSCKAFENALKNASLWIDSVSDEKLELPDIGVVQMLPSKDAEQIMRRIVANMPGEKLQRLSRMTCLCEHGHQLIAEAKVQLTTPSVDLMDNASLLARMASPDLSAAVENLILTELRKRSSVAHEVAHSALANGLRSSSSKSWLHGLIVFLDQERSAHVFDAATGDAYDGPIRLEPEEIIKLNYLFGVMYEMRPEFLGTEIDASVKQEFDRLHDGVEVLFATFEGNSSIPKIGDLTDKHRGAIKSALLDYLGMPSPVMPMKRLTDYEKEFYKIESREHAYANALRRPALNSEGDLSLVCNQFRKDVGRSDIVVGGQLLNRISVSSDSEMSRTFVQRMRQMAATDTQIMTVSKLASQSTSNSYNDLCRSNNLYTLTEEEARRINAPAGQDLSLATFGRPNIHHVISRQGADAIKVRTILSESHIVSLQAAGSFVFTDPDQTAFRAEFECVVDKHGKILPDISISDYSCRKITGFVG